MATSRRAHLGRLDELLDVAGSSTVAGSVRACHLLSRPGFDPDPHRFCVRIPRVELAVGIWNPGVGKSLQNGEFLRV